MKAVKLMMLSLFVLGVAACSKGGDQNSAQGAQEKAQQHVQQPAGKPAGGYDPNADADSDC
ncbi:hypothetical protein [Sulfurivirga sp.]|uniref:hypothetical protein n=1 Tax=Sulfurivirga sp. TaxID=2614236 RepID=UPI0025D4DD86|nr:hypothetical protein [Sulfurivirga sp.]